MINTVNGSRKIAMLAGAAFAMGGVLPVMANAQTGHSIFHRHPTATSAVGGYAAYKAAKRTGANRAASGRHRNFMQRHPVATGLGAAAITHPLCEEALNAVSQNAEGTGRTFSPSLHCP